jgi:hypothetical protein
VLPLIAGSGLFGRLRYMPGVSWYIFAWKYLSIPAPPPRPLATPLNFT